MVAKFKKNRKRKSSRNIFFSILLGVLLLLFIGFLVVTNLKISRRRAELTAKIAVLKEKIQILEQKKEELKENISQAGSEEYLERVAREELGLKASGEEVVVITKEDGGEEKELEEEKKSWWEKIKSIFNR